MDEIENTVCRERNDHDPKRPPETRCRGYEEDRSSQRLENQYMGGGAHDGKQRIVSRDHDRHDRIEGSIAVQAQASGEEAHEQCEQRSDE